IGCDPACTTTRFGSSRPTRWLWTDATWSLFILNLAVFNITNLPELSTTCLGCAVRSHATGAAILKFATLSLAKLPHARTVNKSPFYSTTWEPGYSSRPWAIAPTELQKRRA